MEDLLRQALGPNAVFREGQAEAIGAILEPGARRLLVQATGWGKSVVYFLAARLLADRGRAALVVSPLIALMRNQLVLARKFGLRAYAMHSESREAWEDIEEAAKRGQIDLLLVSPERLDHPDFRRTVLRLLMPRLGLAVVDEVHCVSEWGHDFRPEYRAVLRHLEKLPKDAAILGATATATERVVEDLRKVFGPFLEIQRGRLIRPSLRLTAVDLATKAERLAWLARYLPRFEGSGIVYTLTVFDAKEVARWLRKRGIEAEGYFAELGQDRRIELETAFSENRIKALVATTALGMGYDKADVGFVVHYQMPTSLVAYYQQIGRAGRALDRAEAVLLGSEKDEEIVESFIDSARPRDFVFERLVEALAEGPKPFGELAQRAGVSGTMVRHTLDILASSEAVWRVEDGLYHAEPTRAKAEMAHGQEIRDIRRQELDEMYGYIRSTGCRMQTVANALGDPLAAPCGVCDRCRPVGAVRLDPAILAEAVEFLQSEAKVLVPRAMLPVAVLYGKRMIPKEHRNLPGLVLSFYGDEGLGRLVKQGKYETHHYDDALLEAAVRAVKEPVHWLTWIPSQDPRGLVEFAERLAERLGIEAVDALQKNAPTPPQKTMATGEEQFWNVWSSLEVRQAGGGTVLLLDDIVDSGWTLTVGGLKLRQAGASDVLPLALAAANTSRIKFRDEVVDD